MVERIVRAFKEILTEVGKPKRTIKRGPFFLNNIPWCFFDGACLSREGICGCGIVINLTDQHSFQIQLGTSTCTNTRA